MASRHEDTSVSGLSLPELLQAGWDVQKMVEKGDLTGSSENFQLKLLTAIQQLEEATRLVNKLGLFSTNEEIEEVSTADMKYMLLPALLGDLVIQLMEGDRLDTLHRTQIYFIDYLQRCKDYGITKENPPTLVEASLDGSIVQSSQKRNQPKTMQQLSAERQRKIDLLKAQKETEKKLQHLTQLIQSSDSSHHCDDETIREHTMTLLKLWIYKSHNQLNSIGQEIELLEGMKQVKQDLSAGAVASGTSRPPIKPFVITKDMLKGQVFGAGYPSLPLMSVEEFYDQRYQQQSQEQPSSGDTKEIDKTDDEEEESEETLRRDREFDDFKDDNRRGWGNRKNMG